MDNPQEQVPGPEHAKITKESGQEDESGSRVPALEENDTETANVRAFRRAGERIGPYEILSCLGAGGMGEVYLARDSRLGRDVALKLLPAKFSSHLDRLLRFRQEARAASALNHPNIITIYELGESEAGQFIAMEVVNGQTLRQMIDEAHSLDSLPALGRQIATALSVAHAAGVIHRDIKPRNLMVRRDGLVKVLDFGVARLTGSGQADGGVETAEGLVIGSARYMSPEQALGEEATPASDIFSLGLVFYQMATGRHPFPPLTKSGVMRAIVSEAPLPPSRLNPEIPAPLEALILRMLEKKADFRPTAEEVVAALDALEREEMPPRRHPPVGSAGRTTVGREAETTALRAGFASAAAGRGCVIAVSGEPGIGKTTIVEEFLAQAAAGNHACRIARGRCSERLAGTEAYLPLLEALDNLLQETGGHEAARMMKLIAPSWYREAATSTRSNLTAAQPGAENVHSSQERMKRELTAFFQDVTRLETLVMFLDDLHWADVSTIDLLAYLAGRLDTMRLLLILAYRPSELLLAKHPFLQLKSGWQARGICRELPLEFLNGAEIERYLLLEFAGHQFPPDFCQLVHAKTEGSPLFVTDLLRYLRDRGVISKDQRGWALARAVPEIERELPESVRGMIDRKIAQLSEDDRLLLTAASMQGYQFDSAVVATVLEMDPARVEERLDALERVYDFVRLAEEKEFPDRTLTLVYRFVHVLYQNALFGSVRATRKARLSAAVADALLGFYGERRREIASELAYLFEAARDYLRAAEFFRLAAQQAVQVYAAQEAVTLARRGLGLLEALPDTRERHQRELPLQVVLGSLLLTTRGYSVAEVESAYSRARTICQQLGETTHQLPVLFGLFVNHLVRAKYDKALGIGREFLALAESRSDPAVLVGHRTIGVPLLFLGKLTEAMEQLERSVSLYDAGKHQPLTWLYGGEPGMVVRFYLSWTYWLLGWPERALHECRVAMRLMGEVQHEQSKAYALAGAALLHQYRREAQPVINTRTRSSRWRRNRDLHSGLRGERFYAGGP